MSSAFIRLIVFENLGGDIYGLSAQSRGLTHHFEFAGHLGLAANDHQPAANQFGVVRLLLGASSIATRALASMVRA